MSGTGGKSLAAHAPTGHGQYVVTEDGTIEGIAAREYGDKSLASIIYGANGRTDSQVYEGEVLIIPGEPPPVRLTGKAPEQLTVLVGAREIPLTDCRILRTMDTGTDGWTGTMAWTPGADQEVDRLTRPYGYERAAVYLGNNLVVNGLLYGTAPAFDDQGQRKVLTGYSFTADAVDSNMPPPYERENVTLEQLADELTPLIGIRAVFKADTGGPFARVTAHESDTIFAFLSKLATQRGLLVSCTAEGDMLFHRADTESLPVGTLREGDPLVIEWKADYDGRRRYHKYKCVTAGQKGAVTLATIVNGYGTKTEPSERIAVDKSVPRSRWLTFRADDSTPGNAKDAARWRKNRSIVDALTQELPVSGWYAPDRNLWRVNTRVTVVSATFGVPKGFDFLIRAVEFVLDDRRSSVLYLVPPQAYSKDKDLVDVWSL